MPNREPLAQIASLIQIAWPSWRRLLSLAVGALLSVTVSIPAHAANNAALQRCRMTIGKRIVQSCMQHGDGDVAFCRQKATPAVRRCMMRSGSMGGGPQPDAMGGGAMGGGRFAGRRGSAMGGRGGRLARCKELAYQRGFNGGIKDRRGVGAFVKSCMQGKVF
jgi:hypothetical protein